MPPIYPQAHRFSHSLSQVQEWEREAVVEWWGWVEKAVLYAY